MLDAVNDVADKLEDLAMEHEAAINLNQALRDMRESLRDVQDLYRHQAGRMSAPGGGLYVNGNLAMRGPAGEEHQSAAALPGMGALIPGIGGGR
jgi:hypothetical protein